MSRRAIIDVNADVGEGCGDDAALIPLISSASIACGYHAGDAATIREAVRLARTHDVAVGAHPSFPDREHFGRREMHLAEGELRDCLIDQVRVLAEFAAAEGVRLQHVKPHGALYNMAARDEALAETIASAIAAVDRALLLFGLAGSQLVAAGRRAGLHTVNEAFADRAYRPDGTLVPRSEPDSVLRDGDAVSRRAVAMVRERCVAASGGTLVRLEVESICVHGDTPGAVEIARQIRRGLNADGISVAAPRR